MSSKTSTGNIKDGGLEGTPQLLRTSQSTQTTQISTQLVRKLLRYSLILELANIQPRLGSTWGTLVFKLQLQSCYNKPVVGFEELSILVDPTVLDHLPVTISVHMVNILCHTTGVGIPIPAMSLWALKS